MNAEPDICFVYFGNDWFAENRTSSHHIAVRLGRKYPLLYVEMPGLRAPSASGRDLQKLFRKLRAGLRSPQQIGPHMWHITVPQIPFRRFALMRRVNELFASLRVRSAMRNIGFRSPISWFVVPHPGFLAGGLRERLVVFYCIDNYAALPDVDPVAVAQMDEALVRRADLVFAASPRLVEAKRKNNANVVYSPHGVDADLFGKAADPGCAMAELAAGLPHPVIGFHGVLDDRIDFALIEFLATSRPTWSFLLVGRLAADCAALRQLRNVHTPGAVPYDTLPAWVAAFDVCIMPYRPGAFSANANPLKMREYLAAGRPVVSIPMPEVDQFAPYVAITDTKEDFLEAIEREFASDSEESRRERMRLVAGSTWDARVEEVLAKVAEQVRLRDKAPARDRAIP